MQGFSVTDEQVFGNGRTLHEIFCCMQLKMQPGGMNTIKIIIIDY
jgi:hypothetical protein